MGERSSYAPGTPSWIDLMTPDLDAAKAFYTGLFGWEAEDQFDGDGNRIYTMFRLDGKDVAGAGEMGPEQRDSGMPPVWNTYISVEDVEATSARVESAGGQVMMPAMDVMESGRMAIFLDPAGAAFSAWQAREHIGAQLVNDPGAFCWNELQTREPEQAVDFYTEVFPWTVSASEMPDGDVYREIQLDGRTIAGILTIGDDFPPEVPNNWQTYFSVEDCQAALERVEELGGQVAMPPMELPVGTMAVVSDPQGGTFTIIELSSPPDD